jgi:hypothetical protein
MKYFFALLISCASLSSALSQTFIDTAKSWSISECSCGGWMYYSTSQYKFTNDTVINSIVYKNLSIIDTVFNNSYVVGQMREDTSQKKVYWHETTQDEILYDFSLGVGDTLHNAINPFGVPCADMIVDSILTNNIMGVNRRQWYFNTTTLHGVESWIEGIGNISGIRHNLISCTIDYDAVLLCYKENGVLNYFNPIFNSCYFSTLDIKSDLLSNDFELFPNPSHSDVTIQFSNSFARKIIIRNLLNEIELQVESSDPTYKIKLNKPGFYTVTIVDRNNFITKKLLMN